MTAVSARAPVPDSGLPERFPFGVEFQGGLIRLLCEDQHFSYLVSRYLQPSYFENHVLAWAYGAIERHRAQYGAAPSITVLLDLTRGLDTSIRPLYEATLTTIQTAPLRDEAWLRDNVIEFIRRAVFVKSFNETRDIFNAGKAAQAYDHMMARMDELRAVALEPPDRSWYFEEFALRQGERIGRDPLLESIPTGFPSLDKVLDGGLSVGEFGLWHTYAKGGKALRDDQPVLTPLGWRPIANLKVGDLVIGGSTGNPQRVTGVYPQGVQRLYEVRFRDGASVIASGDHLWTVRFRSDVRQKRRYWGSWRTLKTTDLLDHDFERDGVFIPGTPLVSGCDQVELPIDGYLLGLLLGDGSLESTIRFHKPEKDLWRAIERCLPEGDKLVEHGEGSDCEYVSIVSGAPRGVCRSKTAQALSTLGVLGLTAESKFIPDLVMTSPVSVRYAVLSGLCDTDGSVKHSGCAVEFSSVSRRLADGVAALARSLAGQASVRPKIVNGVTYWRVYLRLLGGLKLPVQSKKNRAKCVERTKNRHRYIEGVYAVDPGSCTCIVVDDPEHLFITSGYVVTHNSTMLAQFGVAATRIAMRRVLHFVYEGSRTLVENRYDAAFTRDLYRRVKRGDIDAEKYAVTLQEFQYLRHKLVIRGFTDRWDYTIVDMTDEIRELKNRYGWVPELIIIDYADLLSPRDKKRGETEEQTAVFRDIKSLANRGYAIWSASQTKRPEDGAEDKQHLIRSGDISKAYEKVRIVDFVGSLNQTRSERDKFGPYDGVMRAYAELYRDNAADVVINLRADFNRMRLWEEPGLVIPVAPAQSGAPAHSAEAIPTQLRAAL